MKKMDNVRRRNALFHFGFGTDVMKNIKICEKCSHPESSMKTFCTNAVQDYQKIICMIFIKLSIKIAKNAVQFLLIRWITVLDVVRR